MCQKEPNPEYLQVIKRAGHVKIVDISDDQPDIVYDGSADLDCMLDAIALHFGFEGTEVHELESNAVDPLDVYKKESLDNRIDKDDDEEGDEIEGDPVEIDPEALELDPLDDDATEVPEDDHGIPDWDDDWEEN